MERKSEKLVNFEQYKETCKSFNTKYVLDTEKGAIDGEDAQAIIYYMNKRLCVDIEKEAELDEKLVNSHLVSKANTENMFPYLDQATKRIIINNINAYNGVPNKQVVKLSDAVCDEKSKEIIQTIESLLLDITTKSQEEAEDILNRIKNLLQFNDKMLAEEYRLNELNYFESKIISTIFVPIAIDLYKYRYKSYSKQKVFAS